MRKPERSDVGEALLKWFKHQRSDNDKGTAIDVIYYNLVSRPTFNIQY
jgi:hypothetical protein